LRFFKTFLVERKMTANGHSGPLGWSAWIALAVVILLGVGYGASLWLKPPTQPDLDEGRATVEEFLTRVRKGKPGEAWDLSTVEFKSIAGRESFIRLAQKSAILREPLQFGSIQKITVQEQPRSEFLYQSTKSGGNVRILLGYEQGAWKVDRLTL
jgi:hypothetical protein